MKNLSFFWEKSFDFLQNFFKMCSLVMEFSKMWLLGLAEGWRVSKKEFAGLDWEGGLLASPDGVGGVLEVWLFGLSECLNHI